MAPTCGAGPTSWSSSIQLRAGSAAAARTGHAGAGDAGAPEWERLARWPRLRLRPSSMARPTDVTGREGYASSAAEAQQAKQESRRSVDDVKQQQSALFSRASPSRTASPTPATTASSSPSMASWRWMRSSSATSPSRTSSPIPHLQSGRALGRQPEPDAQPGRAWRGAPSTRRAVPAVRRRDRAGRNQWQRPGRYRPECELPLVRRARLAPEAVLTAE